MRCTACGVKQDLHDMRRLFAYRMHGYARYQSCQHNRLDDPRKFKSLVRAHDSRARLRTSLRSSFRHTRGTQGSSMSAARARPRSRPRPRSYKHRPDAPGPHADASRSYGSTAHPSASAMSAMSMR
jgi:hypothetical protein